jgi:hypothetical protein
MYVQYGPNNGSRIFWLLFGAGYLGLNCWLISATTGLPLYLSAIAVCAGAAVVTISIGLFCAKLIERSRRRDRIRLSTLFLAFVPISVYMAAMHWIVRGVEAISGDGNPWPAIVVIGIVFFLVTTVTLLCMGEAIAWLLLGAMRARRRGSQDDAKRTGR